MGDFSISLSAVRANKGYSQEEWAKALNVSVSTVKNWEYGKTSPRAECLREMSRLSGIPMDFIFVGSKA